MRTAIGLGLALVVATVPALGEPNPPGDDRWYEVLGPDGQLIGFQHENELATGSGSEQLRERVLAYRVDGHGETRLRQLLVRRFDQDGRLAGFHAEQDIGKHRIVSDGLVTGGALAITRSDRGQKASRSQPWDGAARLSDALAVDDPAGDGFELGANLLRLDPRKVRFATVDGGRKLRLGYSDGWLASAAWLTVKGARAETVALPQLGYDLTIRRSARPIKLAELARAARIPHEMHASPFYVSAGALRGHIRYRFGFPPGVGAQLPQTGEQRVVATGGGWQLDICASCGPGLPDDAASLFGWTRPSRWIESDAREFAVAVRPVLRKGLGETARMEALKAIARERLARTDYEGYLSASAAWRRGSGDCTEDALVLAALARAAGIPARVASGLTYSRTRYHGAADAFLAHTWVIARVDGRWQSYDISLDGFDASHIALALSDGEPGAYRQAGVLAALLDWQGMAEVRTRD